MRCITVKTATNTSCGTRSPRCARRGAEPAVGCVACQQAAESGICMVAGEINAHLTVAQCNQLWDEDTIQISEMSRVRCSELAKVSYTWRILNAIESCAHCLGTPKLCAKDAGAIFYK